MNKILIDMLMPRFIALRPPSSEKLYRLYSRTAVCVQLPILPGSVFFFSNLLLLLEMGRCWVKPFSNLSNSEPTVASLRMTRWTWSLGGMLMRTQRVLNVPTHMSKAKLVKSSLKLQPDFFFSYCCKYYESHASTAQSCCWFVLAGKPDLICHLQLRFYIYSSIEFQFHGFLYYPETSGSLGLDIFNLLQSFLNEENTFPSQW